MKQDVVGENNTAKVRLERTLRRYIMILPVFAVLYGSLILNGWTKGSPLFNQQLLYVFVIVLTLISLLYWRVPTLSNKTRPLFLGAYHIILAFGLIYLYGILNPLLIAWLLIIVITMIIFGKVWSLVSYLCLLVLFAWSYALVNDHSPTVLVNYGLSAIFIGLVALVFSSLYTQESFDQEKLAASKAKQNDQREALLTIINGTSQAIFTLNSSGIIRIYNAALLGLMDTNQSLSGRKVDDIFPLFDQKGEPVSLFELIKTSQHFERDDLTLRFAEGDEIRLNLSVNKIQSAFSPLHQNDGEGYVCMAKDITKQKSLEEERDEFISVVSHELRTPVTIAEGTISNVQYFLDKGSDPTKLSSSLQEAHEQIVLLANMINDLGTLSRADRGVGDNTEEIDLKDLAETMFKNYHGTATKKGLTFDIDLGARLGTITTSRLYLEEMLQNFITNAIKYTASGSVTLKVHRQSDGVRFEVVDSGIGISKADLKHIFEKFYRSEDFRTRETSGTGLGLYVVSKLMHKLGTKVEVKSRLNHGSSFGFTLTNNAQKTST